MYRLISLALPRWSTLGGLQAITSARAQHGISKKCQNNEEESWFLPARKPKEDEKKVIMAAAVTLGVIGAMKNYVYRFDKETRK